MIRTELGISVSNFSLYTARTGAYVALNPYSPSLPKTTGDARHSDWYNYCHTCTPMYAHTVYYECGKLITSGWATRANACASWGTCSNTLYSSSATLGTGSTLYLLTGGVYVPYVPTALWGGGLWYYEAGIGPFQMTNTSNNVILALDTCTPTYYYYDAEYWADCSGVTSYGEIVRSTVPLTLEWTRWDPFSGGSGANYLRITGVSGSTAYTYISDDTENASCGY